MRVCQHQLNLLFDLDCWLLSRDIVLCIPSFRLSSGSTQWLKGGGGGLEPADQDRVASDPKETPPSPRVVTNLVALGKTVLV